MKVCILPKLGLLNKKQLKNLTSKAFRKGWANWAMNHEDKQVREYATTVMHHSKEVQEAHYLITSNQRTADWTNLMLKTGMLSGAMLSKMNMKARISFKSVSGRCSSPA